MDLHPSAWTRDHPVDIPYQNEKEESRTEENAREKEKGKAIEILEEVSRSRCRETVGSDGEGDPLQHME